MRRCGMVGGLVLASSLVATASEPQPAPKGYVCGRASGPVVVDGVIDDKSWDSAPWTTDFVDIEGSTKPVPRFRTRARLLWDADYLYIAAELTDPHVWGNLTEHDSVIFHDNDFEVFLDPDGDNHQYYELEINALNTEWDLFLAKPYRDGGLADNSWEIRGLKKAVRVQGTLNNPNDNDTGWTVELAIPWRDLNRDSRAAAPPQDGDQWRINFSRVEWDTTVEAGKYVKVQENGKNKPEHNWVWSPQGVINMHQPEHWGYLQFTTDKPGVVDYKVDPAGVVRTKLMAIYAAQKAFQQREGRYSATLEPLGLNPEDFRITGLSAPVARLTPAGFEVLMTVAPHAGHPERTWLIEQDSRLSRRP